MKPNVSKAQREVWEWKNVLYEELKKIPRFKKLKYLHNKVKSTLAYLEKDKQTA